MTPSTLRAEGVAPGSVLPGGRVWPGPGTVASVVLHGSALALLLTLAGRPPPPPPAEVGLEVIWDAPADQAAGSGGGPDAAPALADPPQRPPTPEPEAGSAAAPFAPPPSAPDAPVTVATPQQPFAAAPAVSIPVEAPPTPTPPRPMEPAPVVVVEAPVPAPPSPPDTAAPSPAPPLPTSAAPPPEPPIPPSALRAAEPAAPTPRPRPAPPVRSAARRPDAAPGQPAEPTPGDGRERLALPGGGELGEGRRSSSTAPAGPSRPPALADRGCPERNKRYPPAAEARGEAGSVVLRIDLAETGHVQGIAVARSSGSAALDAAARAAMSGCSFQPALRDGTPVPASVGATFHFRPDQERSRW